MSADRIFIFIGAILGFLGVALGAFGAHFLKSRLSPEMLAVFETGVKYHLIHALALLITAWIAAQYPYPLIRLSGWLFFAGVLIFSASLYLLATTGVKAWGAVTPIGGLLLLAGWLSLAIGIAKG
ncbi:MAG: DUF423 domain-containing protein [Elusimicrobia bacterium]|nr:DUF423 domain-containing protein [Elusimicrobiota bacterium]